MGGEEAAKKNLYDAVTKGDVAKFQSLLQEDAYLLDEVSFACVGNLLHLATMCGQAGIVEKVLKINPRLAWSLDSKNSSPLHIAAAQGHVEIAAKLIAIAPEACWWRDCHDMNPVHVAAMNGHVDVLKLLLGESHFPAMEKLHRGQTVLHLCLKHGQVECLKVLVKKVEELVNAKDDDGETLLHWAVRYDQHQAIEYLVETEHVIKMDRRNSMGKTALKVLEEIPKDTIQNHSNIRTTLAKLSHQPKLEFVHLNEITLVVVILIATIAFQVMVNPPGGVWQDDKLPNTTAPAPAPAPARITLALALAPAPAPASDASKEPPPHSAGRAIMASKQHDMFINLLILSSISLGACLVAIFLILSGLTSRHYLFMWLALTAVWVSIASIACCYVVCVSFIGNPEYPLCDVGMWIIIGSIYAAVPFSMVYLFELYPSSSAFWKCTKARCFFKKYLSCKA